MVGTISADDLTILGNHISDLGNHAYDQWKNPDKTHYS